ncbi:MAG: PD-(D/E)XK nuclease family protein [Armatimonadota bacterium]|nr:PD-(D/E)XK nuclease family protein [Armatimonadota bacterium]MDR7438564.1 PD-(D/E)XK nuclease family protein [Armatimonadota bacterium]MDR7567088.1 PD-(D/E)XK nuclease family protein [Armatimonadota bacterium]MDR7602731.1 PD-(D/E)XK nuclease family protein [Armatimonadota bacterium]
MRPIRISVRRLAEVTEGGCPRCFWITYHLPVPYQMPFPGVLGEIDRATKQVIRDHMDRYGMLPGWFPRLGRVVGYVAPHRLRWQVFQVEDCRLGLVLRGEPDEIFRLADGSYHIVDYKTARLTENQELALLAYEVQLNGYAYIAQRLGYTPISGLSLVYLEPRRFHATRDGSQVALLFRAVRRRVRLDPDRLIPPLLRRVREILTHPTPPPGHPECEECETLRAFLTRLR